MELPISYVELDCEEMSYVEGGLSYGQLYVQPTYLLKPVCLYAASAYAGKTLGDGKAYNIVRLAAEIFTHAVLFYGGTLTQTLMSGIKSITGYSNSKINSVVSYVLSHSDPIDLGGDSALRQGVYAAMWML